MCTNAQIDRFYKTTTWLKFVPCWKRRVSFWGSKCKKNGKKTQKKILKKIASWRLKGLCSIAVLTTKLEKHRKICQFKRHRVIIRQKKIFLSKKTERKLEKVKKQLSGQKKKKKLKIKPKSVLGNCIKEMGLCVFATIIANSMAMEIIPEEAAGAGLRCCCESPW